MTTDLAFQIMIYERGVYKKLGISRGMVGKWKYDLKKGLNIPLETKIKYLKKAGYKMRQEMRWSFADDEVRHETKETDYLYDFPGLTFVGKRAGLRDEVIRHINKSIIENPAKFSKIYKNIA